jgi:hypothetical protein
MLIYIFYRYYILFCKSKHCNKIHTKKEKYLCNGEDISVLIHVRRLNMKATLPSKIAVRINYMYRH